MTSRNEVKAHVAEDVYHAYNRGVARQRIFADHFDYQRFKHQLRQSLEREPDVQLLAYCLMPNHYHLMLKQHEAFAASRFMRRLITGYVMYFNLRHDRVGPLFQGKYKASTLVDARALMEVSRYIHLNPQRAGLGWKQYQHSSLSEYLIPGRTNLAEPDPVLGLFDDPSDYLDYLSRAKLRP